MLYAVMHVESIAKSGLGLYKFEQSGEIEKYAGDLEKLAVKCSSTEAIAVDAVNYLYNRFGDVDGVQHAALMRFFRTVAYCDLTPHLQEQVCSILKAEPPPATNCLTLLATRGIESDWNDRLASTSHQVIPLVSEKVIEEAPMIVRLVKRLGIDIARIIEPAPGLFLHPKLKRYNCMYVPEARGSSDIVAQSKFVIPHNIRSVIGFGSLLPTGDMFAVLMFMKVFISRETAERCNLFAEALESSINQLGANAIRARILVAAAQEGTVRLRQLLNPAHEVVVVSTVEQAVAAVRKQKFDMILCGTNFDESRMFDLLSAVKQVENERTKPFICFRQVGKNSSESTDNVVAIAASSIGATCFIDAARMSDTDLLHTVQSYLPKEIWRGN